MKKADYFPLRKGMGFEYAYTSSEFEGKASALIEILSTSKKAGGLLAQARMTINIKGTANSTDYSITRSSKWLITSDGIVVGGRKEYPIPPAVGSKWDEYPDASKIVSLSEKVSVPAGKFKKCMKVVTLLAGGDSGNSVRYYAPRVGYVLEKYFGEDMQAEVKLVSINSGPATPVSRRKR